jgi:hypothetical protein
MDGASGVVVSPDGKCVAHRLVFVSALYGDTTERAMPLMSPISSAVGKHSQDNG